MYGMFKTLSHLPFVNDRDNLIPFTCIVVLLLSYFDGSTSKLHGVQYVECYQILFAFTNCTCMCIFQVMSQDVGRGNSTPHIPISASSAYPPISPLLRYVQIRCTTCSSHLPFVNDTVDVLYMYNVIPLALLYESESDPVF